MPSQSFTSNEKSSGSGSQQGQRHFAIKSGIAAFNSSNALHQVEYEIPSRVPNRMPINSNLNIHIKMSMSLIFTLTVTKRWQWDIINQMIMRDRYNYYRQV